MLDLYSICVGNNDEHFNQLQEKSNKVVKDQFGVMCLYIGQRYLLQSLDRTEDYVNAYMDKPTNTRPTTVCHINCSITVEGTDR